MDRRWAENSITLVDLFEYLQKQWYRQHEYLFDGKYADLESFLKGRWEAGFLTWDANDMLTLFHTWSTADISLVRDGGDYAKALKSIKAKGLIMPSKTDLYFPVGAAVCRMMIKKGY